MTAQVLTQTRVSPARTVTAKIKGYQYPVEVLGYRKQNGYTIVHVRVLPREDGFQPKPFCNMRGMPPTYHDDGEVLKSMLEVNGD